MRTLIFILLILPWMFSRESEPKSITVLITPKSSLVINGFTNVHDFSCAYSMPGNSQTVPVTFTRKDDVFYFHRASLVLENIRFDCGGKGINRDFHKLLQSEEFPEITLEMVALKPTDHPQKFEATAAITIADTQCEYNFPVRILHSSAREYRVQGSWDASLSHFRLEPPRKVMGIIAVKNHIRIDFDMVIKEE